jgi:hypothetical protein
MTYRENMLAEAKWQLSWLWLSRQPRNSTCAGLAVAETSMQLVAAWPVAVAGNQSAAWRKARSKATIEETGHLKRLLPENIEAWRNVSNRQRKAWRRNGGGGARK